MAYNEPIHLTKGIIMLLKRHIEINLVKTPATSNDDKQTPMLTKEEATQLAKGFGRGVVLASLAVVGATVVLSAVAHVIVFAVEEAITKND